MLARRWRRYRGAKRNPLLFINRQPKSDFHMQIPTNIYALRALYAFVRIRAKFARLCHEIAAMFGCPLRITITYQIPNGQPHAVTHYAEEIHPPAIGTLTKHGYIVGWKMETL
jgi:hypothetical protein